MSTFWQKRLTVRMSLALLVAAGLACNLPAGSDGPSVSIQNPANGSALPVGQPVAVVAVAADSTGPGIARVELFANGESVRALESPTGPLDVFDTTLTWTPSQEGEVTLTVAAYQPDGSPSAAATIVVEIIGLTADSTMPSPDGIPAETPAESAQPSSSPASQGPEGQVTGRVVVDANIRSGAGPYCSIVGGVETNTIINLLEYSADRRWLKTDYAGRTGWIYASSVAPQGNTATIPIGNARGCEGCGDGVCNQAENCNTCPGDCGECCGNGSCQPEFGEDCGTCQADCGACCGNRTCEPGRGESCSTCAEDCGSCCGNGLCEAGLAETCASCPADCGNCCGNGLCEEDRGENCGTCSRDCGACCGNGRCQPGRGENCTTCPTDCGVCTPVP